MITHKLSQAAKIDPSIFEREGEGKQSPVVQITLFNRKKYFHVMTSVGSEQLLLCIKLKSLGEH